MRQQNDLPRLPELAHSQKLDYRQFSQNQVLPLLEHYHVRVKHASGGHPYKNHIGILINNLTFRVSNRALEISHLTNIPYKMSLFAISPKGSIEVLGAI